MSVNSKNKGSKAERELAKVWERWTGYKFSRTPMSGGWAKSIESFGDLTCTDPKHSHRFPFSVECKSYKGITFNDILKGTKSDVLRFWEQASYDAKRCNKIPLLFMRENGMAKQTYFLVCDVKVGKLIVDLSKKSLDMIALSCSLGNLLVFNSNDLTAISYNEFYKAVRKL